MIIFLKTIFQDIHIFSESHSFISLGLTLSDIDVKEGDIFRFTIKLRCYQNNMHFHQDMVNINWTGMKGICHRGGKQGAVSIRKTVLPGMAIPMLKIRLPNGRLIFNMEIAIRR